MDSTKVAYAASTDRGRFGEHADPRKFGSRSLRPAVCAAWFSIAVLTMDASIVAADAPLWTDKPLRIDRQKQSYQRVSPDSAPQDDTAAFPIKILKGARFFVRDSGSFMLEGRAHRLAHLVAVEPSTLCAFADGARWACGVRAKVALSRLFIEGQSECISRGNEGDVIVVECRRKGQDVARQIVAAGYAFAAPDDDRYLADEQAARSRYAGIWAQSFGTGQ